MKTLACLVLAAAVWTLPAGCKSTSSAPDLPCRCGTPLGDLEGCDHPLCRAGHANPDNPDCVCGTLDIPTGKEK